MYDGDEARSAAVEKEEQADLGEDTVDSADSQRTDMVQLRDPPTFQPVSLTKSQEMAFKNVEKLQEQLESLVEAGGSESRGSESESEYVKTETTDEADKKSKKTQESPFKSELGKDSDKMINCS